jgi:hypothetical protein
MSWNSLDTGLHLSFSREVEGRAGEDLVEKQNAKSGLMRVVASEAAAYGYEAENRHFVRVFLGKEEPLLTFQDGLDVVKVLMSAYMRRGWPPSSLRWLEAGGIPSVDRAGPEEQGEACEHHQRHHRRHQPDGRPVVHPVRAGPALHHRARHEGSHEVP